MDTVTQNMLVPMAFDIFGIKPRRAHSQCLRFNIWKWNDLRLVLRAFGFFDDVDETLFMSNDGYVISGQTHNKMISILLYVSKTCEIESNNTNWFLKKIYSNPLYSDLVAHHGDCPGSNEGQFSYSDLRIFILFLSDCDGFEIR